METKMKTPPADIPAAQMNDIMRYCALLQDIKIIMHQPIRTTQLKALDEFKRELDRRNGNALAIGKPLPAPESLYLYFIFLYGYISGIRAERQKRRAKA